MIYLNNDACIFLNFAVIPSDSEKKNSWPFVFLVLAMSLQISEFMLMAGQEERGICTIIKITIHLWIYKYD